jgi:methyl coenzyme M reductase subunit D
MKNMFNKQTFKGIITPAKWKDGNVTEISIQTIDEKEYIVEQNEIGKEMFPFINYPVEISGFLKTRCSDGREMISAEKCVTVIASSSDVYDSL